LKKTLTVIEFSSLRITPGSRAGLELRSSGKPVAVQPIVRNFRLSSHVRKQQVFGSCGHRQVISHYAHFLPLHESSFTQKLRINFFHQPNRLRHSYSQSHICDSDVTLLRPLFRLLTMSNLAISFFFKLVSHYESSEFQDL